MAKSKSGLCRHNHSFHLKLFPSLSRQERCWYRGSVFVARKISLSSFSSYFCRGGGHHFFVFFKKFFVSFLQKKTNKSDERASLVLSFASFLSLFCAQEHRRCLRVQLLSSQSRASVVTPTSRSRARVGV